MHFWKHALIFDLSYSALMACTSCQVVILSHLKRWKYQFPTVPNFSQKCPLEDFAGFGGGYIRVKGCLQSHVWLSNISFLYQDISLGVNAVHPLSQQLIPLYTSSRIPFQENVESRLGIPCSCEGDKDFAEQGGIPYETVLDAGSRETGLMNSDRVRIN